MSCALSSMANSLEQDSEITQQWIDLHMTSAMSHNTKANSEYIYNSNQSNKETTLNNRNSTNGSSPAQTMNTKPTAKEKAS